MEPNTPLPEPTAVTPQQPDAASTNITVRPNDYLRWTEPQPPPIDVGALSTPMLIGSTVVMLGMCFLGALLGSWILVFVGGVAALLAFHYFSWGWVFKRIVAEQQRQELLKLAEQDDKLLPDPRRSRHQ